MILFCHVAITVGRKLKNNIYESEDSIHDHTELGEIPSTGSKLEISKTYSFLVSNLPYSLSFSEKRVGLKEATSP